MLGHLEKDTFDPTKNYNEFYSGHKFNPLDEHTALNSDMVLPRVGWALDVAKEIDAKTVLDLCCLDGFASLTLASKLGVKVCGIDLSEPGIALANERATKFDLDAGYINSAIEEVLGTCDTDLVLLFEAIEHFTDVDKVMEVIKTHMKPGATLLVSTPDAEGYYGFGNKDECHLRFYTYKRGKEQVVVTDTSKPLISLPDYLESQGFVVSECEVWNELAHARVTLP